MVTIMDTTGLFKQQWLCHASFYVCVTANSSSNPDHFGNCSTQLYI